MSTVDVGIFRIVDPPTPAHVDYLTTALARCSFGFDLLRPVVDQDRDQAIVVEFGRPLEGAIAVHYPSTLRIVIAPERTDEFMQRVFLHEVGHAVDQCTMTPADEAAFSAWMHERLGLDHGEEAWGGNPGGRWADKMNEAFADMFVAAYAPELFAAHGRVRTTHHVADDLATFAAMVDERARIASRAGQAPTPKPENAARPPADPKETTVPPLRVKVRRQRQRLRNLRQRLRNLRARVRRLERRR